MRILAPAIVLLAACSCPPPTSKAAPRPPEVAAHTYQGPLEGRVALLSEDDEDYDRLEGVSRENSCSSDSSCFVGGCNAEVCSAAEEVTTTCATRPATLAAALCGCIASECRWYRPAHAPTASADVEPEGAGAKSAGPGEKCEVDDDCTAGFRCTRYYGIAGESGPVFFSCEAPCKSDKDCPSETACVVVSDGPGSVCRPAPASSAEDSGSGAASGH